MTDKPKTITRGNLAKCIWENASEEDKKKMIDAYDLMVRTGYSIVIMPKPASRHETKSPD